VDPDLPEAAQLRTWYDTVGRGAVTAPAGEGLANGRCAPQEQHIAPLAVADRDTMHSAPTADRLHSAKMRHVIMTPNNLVPRVSLERCS